MNETKVSTIPHIVYSCLHYFCSIYNTICIGTQEWLSENWRCESLDNGTALTKVTSDGTWSSAGAGNFYYCAYDNNDGYV